MLCTLIASAVLLLSFNAASHAQIEYLEAKAMVDRIQAQASPVRIVGEIPLKSITWGGDVATIYTEMEGIFEQNGVSVKLEREDILSKQVEACLRGETPYLRGTMGMINAAAEVFKRQGIDLVVIYQLTWSVGGDAMVTRKQIKKPGDLRDRTIALQLDGPHMDYAANILANANVPLEKVRIKWLQELTLPTADTGGRIIDPVSAFQQDSKLDAVMCIIPDALMLTSGGAVGTGAEGSVKDAKIMLSTKTASRVIADVYAVRGDYFAANREEVQRLVHALLQGQEQWVELMENKAARQAKYQQVLSKAADLLLGSPTATGDVEALLGDCEFVGYNGNVAFLTGRGTTRSLATLTQEIQSSYAKMGLMRGQVPLKDPAWDYAILARGLSKATAKAPAPREKFDAKKVAKKVEQRISAEPTAWEEEGTLFVVEINFAPNQSEFTQTQYADDWQKALEISQAYGGALIIIEGHSDPLGILKAEKNREKKQVIDQMRQMVKNLSLQRAQNVRTSFLEFGGKKGIELDASRFVAVGMGVQSPKFSPPRTQQEWEQNRRVVFRIKQVESELAEFSPLE